MNTKMRSERFWKCCNVVFETHTCHRINPAGHPCKCGNFSATTDSPATNVEVLVAWLQASDERRREIEIASAPKEPGDYIYYEFNGGVPLQYYSGGVTQKAVDMACEFDGVLWCQLSGDDENESGYWKTIEAATRETAAWPKWKRGDYSELGNP